MSTLNDFISTVRTMIRDQNSSSYTFQDPDLTTHINSAVRTYSRYRKRKKPYTLSFVSGQSQYTLPSDWITVDLESFQRAIYSSHNEIHLDEFASFVLPNLNNSIELQDATFNWYDSDHYLIVNPTPQYLASFTFDYYIAHSVDSSSSTIPDIDLDNVCYLASAEALKALVVDKGSQMQKYKIGQGLTIDDSSVAKHLMDAVNHYYGIFEHNVIKRPYGVRG